MTDTRVGVLGCGAWGLNHVRVWGEMGRLAAVGDPSPAQLDRARALAPDVDIHRYPEEVLDRSDVDAVVVATPAVTHAELALRALEAGKHVLVEKPLTTSVGEAEKLVEVADRANRVLMVGHVLEYHPVVLKLRELLEDGALGKVRYLYSNRLNFGRLRTEENALWSFAPHDIALMLRLMGSLPTEAACRGGAFLSDGVVDVTLMSLRFPGPIEAHVFVSWLHPFKEHRFVVVGDRQMAVFDDTAPWPEKLVLFPHRVDWVGGRLPVARKADAERIAVEPAEPLKTECEHFLQAIEGSASPLTDGSSGIWVLRVLEAAQRSLDQGGQPVSVRDGGQSSPYVHPTSVVGPGARIGEGTRIWHYSHVMDGAMIGDGCVLGQNVFVGRNVRIGDGVKIQNNVSVYEGVELEDRVFCGPSVVFTNVISPRSEIERKTEFLATRVLEGATLGANSTIVCGVTIGRYAFVGAGAVVTRNVPDHALVIGIPARIVGWACRCGQRLPFARESATCPECGRSYRTSAAGELVPSNLSVEGIGSGD